jgi:hypothetical protein
MYEKLDSEEHREKYCNERKRLSENHYNRANTIGAWLLATLVATNLAAAAAVMSYGNDRPVSEMLPLTAFVIGVVSAIVSGFVATMEARKRSTLYYLESYGEEALEPEGLALLQNSRMVAPRLSRIARWLNYGSLGSFVIGCLWSGIIVAHAPPRTAAAMTQQSPTMKC